MENEENEGNGEEWRVFFGSLVNATAYSGLFKYFEFYNYSNIGKCGERFGKDTCAI